MTKVFLKKKETKIQTIKSKGEVRKLTKYEFDLEKDAHVEDIQLYIFSLIKKITIPYSFIQIVLHYPNLADNDKNSGWRSTEMYKSYKDVEFDSFAIDSDGVIDEGKLIVDAFEILLY